MRYFFVCFIVLFFVGCGNVNLVLLPESSGKVGKIKVTKDDGKVVVVDKAYQKVELIDGESEILSKEEVASKYGAIIKALPTKPKSFILYFQWDSTKVVEKSKLLLSDMIKKSKEDHISYIDVIGYTDRAGDDNYNKILSLRRAKAIKKILVKNAYPKEKISVFFYGEANPIVKTADGVPRKVNRRVEVILK